MMNYCEQMQIDTNPNLMFGHALELILNPTEWVPYHSIFPYATSLVVYNTMADVSPKYQEPS